MLPLWTLVACEEPEPEIHDAAYLDLTSDTDVDADSDADTDADTDTDTDPESGTETGTLPTVPDTTNAAAYVGPPRVMYGTGEFFVGEWVVLDPTDQSEIARIDTGGTTIVGCSAGWLGAMVSSFEESKLIVIEPDGTPVFQVGFPTLTFPSAFTEMDGSAVLADEGRPAMLRYDTAGASLGTFPLSPIADGDGMAEPRWLVHGDDGALWIGVDRYNQLIGVAGASPNGGAGITVIEPGADRPTELWPLGTRTITSPHVVAHDGKVWIGVLGTSNAQNQLNFDGGLRTFDLASRTFTQVVGGTAMNHVVERVDGGGMWVTELVQGSGDQVVSIDWDGTRGTALPLNESPTGIGADDAGNLWIADRNGLRVVDPVSGTPVASVVGGRVGSMRLCR